MRFQKDLSFTGRKILLALADVGCFLFVYLLFAVVLSNSSFSYMAESFMTHIVNACVFLAFIMCARVLFRVYTNVWRYANAKVYLSLVFADIVGGITAMLLMWIVREYYVGIWGCVCIVTLFDVLSLSSRFVYQYCYQRCNIKPGEKNEMNKINVAIVGAGQIGALLAEELKYNVNSHYRPVCFIDRDDSKVGSRICGLKVHSDGYDTIELIKNSNIQEIFIALPSVTDKEAGELCSLYENTGCKIKFYDVPVKDAFKEDTRPSVKEIKIEDLLCRDTLNINNSESKAFYKDKIVLVTGGGGSIGSEICRQIACCEPKKLVILDIYENNAYNIQQELYSKYKYNLDLAVEIASVRDVDRLDCIFNYYRPDVVFHAAAHKHVPLMEHSACEAIKNNVLGTYNTANAAEKYGVGKFILISTDKAVNPTNVMGASKRMCEMVIQCRTDSKTSFAAVRFGNVLGSNGSVIPLFKSQIEAGGPVTVTDKRIIRYFMTIPEASQLVIQAGAMAKSGELFVLDMGKPVRILELAENMIRLSGFKPYVDIDIIEIGLRPGEKLYEELLMKTETLDKTDNRMIFIERDNPFSREEIESKLNMLKRALLSNVRNIDMKIIVNAMKEAVLTYCDADTVNKNASESDEMKMVE